MRSIVSLVLGLFWAMAGAAPQAPPPAQTSTTAAAVGPQQALVNQYCVTCHSEKVRTAGIVLEKLDVQHPGALPSRVLPASCIIFRTSIQNVLTLRSSCFHTAFNFF